MTEASEKGRELVSDLTSLAMEANSYKARSMASDLRSSIAEIEGELANARALLAGAALVARLRDEVGTHSRIDEIAEYLVYRELEWSPFVDGRTTAEYFRDAGWDDFPTFDRASGGDDA